MAIFSGYFQFYPADLKRVELTYLRLPKTPYYAYTIDEETDEYIFTETGTQHFEFPADRLTDIVRMILSYVNINLKEFQVVQYAEAVKEKGV